MSNKTIQGKSVRVRIAPSPTGDPHVGTAYVALFNYAFAKAHGGQFVLRIEDTDQVRAKSSSQSQIESSLRWLGLNWDEGPDCGGPHEPYLQSQRTEIYKRHCQMLVEDHKAYPCFCTSERLDDLRASQKAQRMTTGYDRLCRDLSPNEVARRIEQNESYVVRLKMPIEGKLVFEDYLRGTIEINAEQLDDQVLLKADGYPTYHLANVVDDHLMEISHVIRAEEWISSTPKHVTLYKAFGWQEPVWVHLPLLRNPNKTKISKRKSPVSLNFFRRAGFLPEALVNFLGLMGWSYGGDREVFTLEEMIEVFDLKKISLGDPVFDIQKLTWLNQIYLHKMDPDQFADHLLKEVFTRDYFKQLHSVALERLARFDQFVDNNDFFFSGSLAYKHLELVPKSHDKNEFRRMVKVVLEALDDLYDWRAEAIGETLARCREELEWKPKDYFMTLRMAITGRKDSPPLNETLELIGREMVRYRLRDILQNVVP